MRERLLQFLVCPYCKNELALRVSLWGGNEILEGTLGCQCGQLFPIIGGVPRLLGDRLRKKLPQLYPDFFHRHPDLFNSELIQIDNLVLKKKKEIMDRFGYEWIKFYDYNCDNFNAFIAPLPNDFFKGKLGLDAGCGAGRHARQASEKGAEIVGIDFSRAVDVAHRNNAENVLIHIVQADIYHLPFKFYSFDFIYSLGVIHHLPDPWHGYETLIDFLRKNGALFIWLYAYSPRKVALEILRALSQRLSNANIKRMAYLCNLIDYGIFINTYRLIENLPFLEKLANRYFPSRIKEYANHGFRVGFADWFDRLAAPITNYYKEIEMQNWLKHSGLSNTKLLMEGDSWWWLYGERKG